MSERSFDGAPNVGHDFGESSREALDGHLEYDAQNWEPMEEPSEKRFELHFTPGGSLEEEVHTQLDDAARARIREAERQHEGARELTDEKELDFAGDFDEARRNACGWDPESQREYESFTGEFNAEMDSAPIETGERFVRDWEAERGDDYEH